MHSRRLAVVAAAAATLLISLLPAAPAASEGGQAAPITLSGVVTDPDGIPVAGAEVQVGVVISDEGTYVLVERLDAVLTDAAGGWSSVIADLPWGWGGEALPLTVVVLPPADRVLARTWWGGCVAWWSFGDLYPTAILLPWFAPWRQEACGAAPEVPAGSSIVRDVQLQRGASLDVAVRGSGGAGLEGATVAVGTSHVPDGELVPGAPHEHATAVDGVASVAALGTGHLPVSVDGPAGYRGSFLEHVPHGTWRPRYDFGPTIELGPTAVEHRTVWLSPACDPADPWPYPDVDPVEDHGWDPLAVGDGGDGPVVCGEVRWATDAGIATGYADGTFRPEVDTSRAAIVAWLWRRAGEPAPPPGAPTFSDVVPTSPFRDAIAWAAAAGITGGYADGTFRPSAPATTQAVVVMAWRAASEPGWPHPVGPYWPDRGGPAWDLPVGHPFRSPLRWALSEGIVDPGVAEGGAIPGEPLPRGVAAGVVHDLDARLGAAAAG